MDAFIIEGRGDSMEIRVLRYFLTVVREENISRAAEVLHITQPTLSRQLSELETELGTQLLIRGKRRITLTDAGMLLRRRAEEIVALADKTQKEFGDPKDLVGGIIYIGSAEAAAAGILSELVDTFTKKYPQVQFDIYTGNADLIKERIDQGLIDVALLLEPVEIERYDFLRLPGRERWGVLLSASSPLAQKPWIVPEDLVSVPLSNTSRSIVQKEIAGWFGDYYDQLNIFATHNLIGNTARMVAHGLGAAITIEGAVDMYKNPQLCFRPFYPELATTAVLVWKKYQPAGPAVTRFIQEARQMIGAWEGTREK